MGQLGVRGRARRLERDVPEHLTELRQRPTQLEQLAGQLSDQLEQLMPSLTGLTGMEEDPAGLARLGLEHDHDPNRHTRRVAELDLMGTGGELQPRVGARMRVRESQTHGRARLRVVRTGRDQPELARAGLERELGLVPVPGQPIQLL